MSSLTSIIKLEDEYEISNLFDAFTRAITIIKLK